MTRALAVKEQEFVALIFAQRQRAQQRRDDLSALLSEVEYQINATEAMLKAYARTLGGDGAVLDVNTMTITDEVGDAADAARKLVNEKEGADAR